MLLVFLGAGVGLGVALMAAAACWMAWQRHSAETAHAGASASLDGEGVLAEAGAGQTEQPALQTEQDVERADGATAATGPSAAAGMEGVGQEEAEDSSDLAPRPRVWVRLLGAARVEVDGVEVRVPGRRLELLCYFLLHPDGVSLARVVDALWPEVQPGREPETFANALRRLRGDLRKATCDPGLMVIEHTGEQYRLDSAVVAADVWEFRHAVQAARHAQDVTERTRWLERATGLYRGVPAGGAYSWADPIEQNLREEAVDSLMRLAELRQQTGDLEGAGDCLRDAVGADPVAEGCVRQLMRAQARLGRIDAVRRTYRQLEERLAELDEAPEPPTRRLRDELISACAADLTTLQVKAVPR